MRVNCLISPEKGLASPDTNYLLRFMGPSSGFGHQTLLNLATRELAS